MKKTFTINTALDFAGFLATITTKTRAYVEKEGGFKPLNITIEEHKVKRTNLQNSFYWANATSIANLLNEKECFIDKMGVLCKWSKDDVDVVNKSQFGTNSTSKLSTKEFCDLMENTFAFWIEKTKGEWQPLETAESYFAGMEEGKIGKRI